jgi:hypothetical protein
MFEIHWYVIVIFAIWGLPLSRIVQANLDAILELDDTFPPEEKMPIGVIKTLALIYGLIWPFMAVLNIFGMIFKGKAGEDHE